MALVPSRFAPTLNESDLSTFIIDRVEILMNGCCYLSELYKSYA